MAKDSRKAADIELATKVTFTWAAVQHTSAEGLLAAAWLEMQSLGDAP